MSENELNNSEPGTAEKTSWLASDDDAATLMTSNEAVAKAEAAIGQLRIQYLAAEAQGLQALERARQDQHSLYRAIGGKIGVPFEKGAIVYEPSLKTFNLRPQQV